MNRAAEAQEITLGIAPAIIGVAVPATVISIPPIIYESAPGYTNPVRAMDIAGISNFFDHSGNSVHGVLIAGAVITGGLILQKVRHNENKNPLPLALAAAGTASVGNILYEEIQTGPFDAPDAAFGAFSGTLFTVVFAVSALRARRKRKQSNT